MRAAVMYGKGDIRIEDVPMPEAQPGELLIRVTTAGICGSDLGEYVHGPKMFPLEIRSEHTGHLGPMIPGHEFGGRVVAIGDGVEGFSPGDLVASGAGISCGMCFQCRSGRTNLCGSYWTVGLQRNGGLAEYVAVPASACLEVASHGLTDATVSLAQPMSIAVHSMRRGRPDGPVVVIGAGGIGAFLVYALLADGHTVTVVDVDPEKLLIPEQLGATGTTDPADLAPAGVVYEASGSEAGLHTAIETTLPGGRTVVIGLQKAPRPVDVLAMTLGEQELIGTNAHPFGGTFEDAAKLIGDRTESWSDFAPDVLPLRELTESVLPAMAANTSVRIKNLFDPGLG